MNYKNTVNYIVLREGEIIGVDLNQFKEVIRLFFEYKKEYVLYVGIYKEKMSCVEKSREEIIDEIVNMESCSKFIKADSFWQ